MFALAKLHLQVQNDIRLVFPSKKLNRQGMFKVTVIIRFRNNMATPYSALFAYFGCTLFGWHTWENTKIFAKLFTKNVRILLSGLFCAVSNSI